MVFLANLALVVIQVLALAVFLASAVTLDWV